jgi:hypothetical protein
VRLRGATVTEALVGAGAAPPTGAEPLAMGAAGGCPGAGPTGGCWNCMEAPETMGSSLVVED